MYALDTNTLIYFFKGIGRVKDHLLAVRPAEIAIPSVVLYELALGIGDSEHASRRRRQLDTLLAVVKIYPFDTQAAQSSAELKRLLVKAGTPIGPMDTLIAGTAMANGATLITHNTREFKRVRGLPLADWY